tara:strand:- start:252 stop:509 length:258 start_codon:yes stop_codon:yes gene_type:complete
MITCQDCHGYQYEMEELISENLPECTCYLGASELMALQNNNIERQLEISQAEAQRAQAGWVKEIENNRTLRHQIIALQKDARNRT